MSHPVRIPFGDASGQTVSSISVCNLGLRWFLARCAHLTLAGFAVFLNCCFSLIASPAADDFSIAISRDKQNDVATFGRLSVNANELCFTMEPPLAGGGDKGRIPAGTYTGFLRYDKKDQWRIQLDEVPNFKGIQIHIGNIPKDTKGCILVGLERNIEKGLLEKSGGAYSKLKETFYGSDNPNSTPNKRITIKISDNF